MFLPLNRLHRTFPVAFSACCLALPLLQSGCSGDVDAADKKVREQISEGTQKQDTAVSAAPSVPEGFKKAAAVANASPEAKVDALMRLAEAERDRALGLMTEADRQEIDLLRLVGATNRQTARIQANNTLIAGLAKQEPTKATQAIQEQRAAAQGDQKPVWVEHETGPIEALKGLEARSKELQDQIAQLESQSKDLGTQRSKLVADAEQLEKQSDQAQGDQSRDLFNQSVDARKHAADLSVQAEAVEAKLVPLREDLGRVQANQQAVAKTIQTFGTQLERTQQDWQKIQQQIAELQNLNKRILGGGGNEPGAPAAQTQAAPAAQPEAETPAAGGAAGRGGATAAAAPMPDSITGKLRLISSTASQIEAKRSEAESLLLSAIKDTGSAGTTAATLVRSVGEQMNAQGAAQRPERPAWQRLTELNNPSRFKLQQATLQIILADLYRGKALDLAARSDMQQALAAALQPAKLTVPPEAGADVKADAEKQRQASIAQYSEAEKGLQDVMESPRSNDMMGEAAKAAQLMQLVRLYSQAQADPQVAATLAAKARSLAARGEEVNLPPAALPEFIQTALELRGPATTGPSTNPATQPAGAAPGATTPGATTPGATTPAAPDAGTPAPPTTPGTPPAPGSVPAPGATGTPPAPGAQ